MRARKTVKIRKILEFFKKIRKIVKHVKISEKISKIRKKLSKNYQAIDFRLKFQAKSYSAEKLNNRRYRCEENRIQYFRTCENEIDVNNDRSSSTLTSASGGKGKVARRGGKMTEKLRVILNDPMHESVHRGKRKMMKRDC